MIGEFSAPGKPLVSFLEKLFRIAAGSSGRDNPAMQDLSNPFWIKLKGILFLFIGLAAAALVLLDNPKWQTAGLLIVAIWSCCRFYYFAFYVIEKYVDPGYKFSGLIAFAKYFFQRRR